MAQKTLTFLKEQNRDFTNVLDSMVPYKSRLTPETLFKWDYISCPTPIVSNLGLSAHGVLADGDLFSMIFPGPNG